MKKLFSLLACTIAAVAVLASCTPKEVPDGKCELTAFSLDGGIAGTIDAAAKTITVVIPTSVTTTTFTPTFTVTEYDTVTIGGTAATSGETAVTIADGTKVVVSDEKSALSVEYTIVVKQNDQAAELIAVSFKAADNSLLEEDVTPDAIAAEMVVRVPSAAFRQELTVTVEAGFNDEIKVNNTAVASGSSIKVDTSFPIDITVTDAIANTSASYVLKVGKILQYVVSELGSYAEGTMNDFTMTINPADNMPYFAYTRKLEGESNNGVSLAKWNGSAFELVGPTGAADASARAASKPQVAFSKDGAVYVKYLAGEVASKPTVKKLDGTWTLLGAAGCGMEHISNTSNNYPFFIHPANNKPSFFWAGNTKKVATYRTMNLASFEGDTWSSSTITGVIPALGSDNTNANYYTSSAVLTDSKVFIASSFNKKGYYVHEVNGDGSLTTIVDDFIPEGAEYGLPGNFQLKQGPNDGLYVMGAVYVGDGSMQIYTVDKNANTLKAYGAGLPVTIGSSGSIDQGFGFAIDPANDLTVCAYTSAEGTTVFSYLDDNLQWSNFAAEAPGAGKKPFFVEFNKLGTCYIAYLADGKIQLFSVALEEDIIPE